MLSAYVLKVLELQVWNSARFMLNLMRTLERKEQLVSKSKSVIDVSSGTGCCGIGASALGATNVTITDLPELLPLVQANIQKNELEKGKIYVEALQWEDTDIHLSSSPFDLLLVSDLTYEENSSSNLLRCLDRISAEGSTLLLVHRLRNEPWEQGVFEALEGVFTCEILQEDFARDFLKMRVIRGTKNRLKEKVAS